MMGEYSHALDDKGRIIIPAKLRDALGEGFVITKGLDGCLFIFPMAEWNQVQDRVKGLPMTNANARAFSRFLLAGAQDVVVDKQFRVTLPPRLREHAGIVKDVVFLGMGNRVELWAADRWEQYQKESDLSYETVAEKMVDFGF